VPGNRIDVHTHYLGGLPLSGSVRFSSTEDQARKIAHRNTKQLFGL